MLGRPHTMPGGKMHWPLWVPYELYGTIDYVYGFPHYEEKGGWGPTQAFGNAIETSMYFLYLYIAFTFGREESTPGRGAPDNKLSFGRRKVVGREAGIAVLIGFTTAVMTWWKTFLYCESCSRIIVLPKLTQMKGSSNSLMDTRASVITMLRTSLCSGSSLSKCHLLGQRDASADCGHSGAWLIGSGYMIYIFGAEILQGLEIAAGLPRSKKDI